MRNGCGVALKSAMMRASAMTAIRSRLKEAGCDVEPDHMLVKRTHRIGMPYSITPETRLAEAIEARR